MNLWIPNYVLTIKNVFTAIRVACVSGGSGQKPQNGQFKAFLPINFKAHKLGFYKMTF